MGGEERLEKSRWRIDGWGHGVYLENVKANLFATGKWIRFARRRNRKTNTLKSKRNKWIVRFTWKWKGCHWEHIERFASRLKRISYSINEPNGWTSAWWIHWIFTVSIANAAISNDEIDAAKRVTNGRIKKTKNNGWWWWFKRWWLYGNIKANENNG